MQSESDSEKPDVPPRRAPREFPDPPAIPHHTLLRRIGSGAYGDVWLARNSMGAFRAIKIVYRSSFSDERPFERELSGIRKFEPISRSHEGFIDVLHVGHDESADYFFYIMEIGDSCDGGAEINPETYVPKTLAREISSRGRLTVRDCLELGSALAKALHRLHQHGLVHRDIKPSNIIFVDGLPKLADIGLVTGVDETRSYVGTEGFIPPEGPGAPQADVFSLGRVLYEASTGKDRQYFPELPASVTSFPDPVLFLELNEVILRACKSDPNQRYASAADLQADLIVLLDGKSVRRLRVLESRLSAAKRGVFAVAVFLLFALAVAYPFYRDHREQAEARQREIGSEIAYGNQLLESGDFLSSLRHFVIAFRLHHEGHISEAADRRRLGTILAQCPKLTHYWHEPGSVADAEFSPDGTHIVVIVADRECLIYDLNTGAAKSLIRSDLLFAASYSRDGKRIAVADGNKAAKIFDAATLKLLVSLPHSDEVRTAHFSPDGSKLVTSSGDGMGRIWNIDTRTVEHLLPHKKTVRCAQFSHDGRMVGTASSDLTACLWDAQSGQLLTTLPHPSWVYCIAFSADDSQVATVCADHNARVWQTNGLLRQPLLPHDDITQWTDFNPDGRWLLTSSLDGTVKLWDADTLLPLAANPVLRNGERVTSGMFSGDGRRVVMTGTKGAIAIWDFSGQAQRPKRTPCVPSDDGKRVLFMTPSNLLVEDAETREPVGPRMKMDLPYQRAKINFDGTLASVIQTSSNPPTHKLIFFDVAQGTQIGPAVNLASEHWAVCLGMDGRHAAAVDGDVLHFIDARAGTDAVHQLPTHGIDSVELQANAERLVTWSVATNFVQVWSMPNAELCYPALIMDGPIGNIVLSPDSTKLFACCWDNTLNPLYGQFWDLATGREIGHRLMHGDGVLTSRFSADGKLIGTGSEDFSAGVWSAEDQHRIRTVRHHNQVQSVAFSANASELLTGSLDDSARIWSVETGNPLSPPFRHHSYVRNAMFLGRGDRIYVELGNDVRYLWDVKPLELPIDDVTAIASVICGVPNDLLKDGTVPDSRRACEEWHRLRLKYPALFETTDAAIARWHDAAAEDCEYGDKWPSAVFHLEPLAQSGDTNALARLARAQRRVLRQH